MADQEREERLRREFEKLKDGPRFVLKAGQTPGTYSVMDPMAPKTAFPAWTDLSLEQAEELAGHLVAMWEEDKTDITKNNNMAAEELAKLKQEWDKLTDQKRAIIVNACPWFGVYFGVIHKQ